MKFSSPSPHRTNRTAIFWAVVSQSIWLPVFLSSSQDKLSATNKSKGSFSDFKTTDQIFSNRSFQSPESTLALGRADGQNRSSDEAQSTGIVLNSVLHNQQSLSGETSRTLTSAGSFHSNFLAPPPPGPQGSGGIPTQIIQQPVTTVRNSRIGNTSTTNLIHRLYSRSELLGGTLTLQDLTEPSMPPMARAERAQWSRSGDPLASLPSMWREPMRRALNSLSHQPESASGETSGAGNSSVSLDPARLVHVPSTKIRRASQVPLALQADGSVDILNQPDDPAIIEEINRWSAKQQLPAKGKIRPAVVHLHPMNPSDMGRSINDTKVATKPSQVPSASVAAPLAPSAEPKITPAAAPAGVTPLPAANPPAAAVTPAPPAPATSAIPQPASTPGPAAASEADTGAGS